MNIFYLDQKPETCAQLHCDKHVVKMIIEYAQLMSTAHRTLDGEMYVDKTANGRSIKRWRLNENEDIIYKASHINHPSGIWTRASDSNYTWLYTMWVELCNEYTHRYGRTHLTEEKLAHILAKITIWDCHNMHFYAWYKYTFVWSDLFHRFFIESSVGFCAIQ